MQFFKRSIDKVLMAKRKVRFPHQQSIRHYNPNQNVFCLKKAGKVTQMEPYRAEAMWNLPPNPNFPLLHFCYMPYQPTVDSDEPIQVKTEPVAVKREEVIEKGPPLEQRLILTREDLERAALNSISKKLWSEAEDNLLLNLREKQNMDWEDIAPKLQGRNKKMCYSRYKRLKYNSKTLWRQKDDKKLLRLVEQLREHWKSIALHFKHRNQRQLKEHYINYLRDGISTSEWSVDEELRLVDFLNREGKSWHYIEQHFPGRSLTQIKNRYFGKLIKINARKLRSRQEEQSRSDSE